MKSVWSIPAPTRAEKVFGKHPAQKPVELLERILLASTEEGDLVLDPFCGSGTTGIAAARLGRMFVGIDVEGPFLEKAKKRYEQQQREGGVSDLLGMEAETAKGSRSVKKKGTGGLF